MARRVRCANRLAPQATGRPFDSSSGRHYTPGEFRPNVTWVIGADIDAQLQIEPEIKPVGGDTFNVAAHLPAMAADRPDGTAVVVTLPGGGPSPYRRVSYAELESLSNRYANGLASTGMAQGMRTLVMVRPGVEFIALFFALFKLRAVPVLIDPGMGLRQMLGCIQSVEPAAMIAIPAAQAVRKVRPGAFRSVRHLVTVGRRWFWGGPTLDELAEHSSDRFDMQPSRADDVAAILFTSGSTGPPKGVVYEHGMFASQVRLIRDHYAIQPGDVDLSAFPLFALFGPGMGMASVFPDMNPSRPAEVDPAKLVRTVSDQQANSAYGSPAVWRRVANYCLENKITLPTLRRVLMAGAPVSWQLLDRLTRVLDPAARIHTPYGATEALPIASISAREVLEETSRLSRAGAGTCVGQPLDGIDVRIIRLDEDPITEWSEDLALPAGEIGEIVVRGPVVTKQYYGLPDATAQAKINDGSAIWHRMGDVGYLDDRGRLWFCGRKAHRVVTASGTMFSVQCEAIFNEHPDVYRSALVGLGPRGRQRPVVVIEPEQGRFPRGRQAESFRDELLRLGQANELTRDIRDVLFHRGFPVDVRHNVKIDREALARWAAKRVR
ncbi:MAG: AMP-binding protein [bacterium]|nr:AMP-binding protein [bacterium]